MPKDSHKPTLLYIAALICFMAVGLFMFTKSDFFAVRTVSIEGLNRVAGEEVTRLLGPVKGENLFLMDTEALAHKVKLHPLIDTVEIAKKMPAALTVTVHERVPAALILKGDTVVEVDSRGVIMKIYEAWPKNDSPVLTGIDVPETLGPGQKIDDPQLTKSLALLGQAPQELLALIGEVSINAEGQAFIYLTSGVQIRLGHGRDYQTKLELLHNLINSAEYKSVQNAIKYIDLTAGKPVLGR